MEHWFILHFEDCGRAFQRGGEALSYLKKLWPEYHKTKIDHFNALKENLPNALERIQKINLRQNELPVFERNPYSSIADLITFFQRL